MTEGSVGQSLLLFALPLFLGNIFQQLYSIVDSTIVGKYVGTQALAQVGASGSLNWLFFSLCLGLSAGVGVLVAQSYGAQEVKTVKDTVANSFYLVVGSGLLVSAASFVFTKQILVLLNTPDDILAGAVAYMRVICIGLFFVSIGNGVASVMRATGDSKTPLFILVVSSFVNIVLDLVFVCIFKWGVVGAAEATVVSQIISCILSLIYAFRYNSSFELDKNNWYFQSDIIKNSVRIGIPMALQSALVALSCVMLQGIVNSFGTIVIATFTATSRIEQFIQQPFSSLETGISVFSGQNLGAKKIDRVVSGYRLSLKWVGIFSLAMVLLIHFFGVAMMGIFTDTPEVWALGFTALKITSYFYLPLGIIFLTRGLLNGSGDARYAFAVGVVEVIGRVGGALLIIRMSEIGAMGIWYVSCLTWSMTALFSVFRYRQKKWTGRSLV